jgi:aspartyl aminopeptidase
LDYIISSHLSSKEFNFKSSPTSNKNKKTLKVAVTPYPPDKSTL